MTKEIVKPKRQRVKKIEGGPQGPGAWVELRMPTIEESREYQTKLFETGIHTDEAEEMANNYLASHILSWNWVDDDDNPLPMPQEDPSIFEKMLPDEMMFLGNALQGIDTTSQLLKKR